VSFDQDALPAPLQVRLAVMPEVDCPYLPERRETVRGLMASAIDGSTYQAFMDAGFRRSGRFIYQPVCRGCAECVPLRVPVSEFTPSTSQRRCSRRNQDLVVSISSPTLTDEKAALYRRYVQQWHHKSPSDADDDTESLRAFLYDSPTDSLEFVYRDLSNRLLAVGLCDVTPNALSSVYFYFDPDDRQRSLGTFGALTEIEWCRRNARSYYYLGFLIKGCAAMNYKASYRPHELLGRDGNWQPTLSSS
jgi:arginine-tRNA-protein transferase